MQASGYLLRLTFLNYQIIFIAQHVITDNSFCSDPIDASIGVSLESIMTKPLILSKILTTIGDQAVDFYDIFESLLAASLAGYRAPIMIEREHNQRQWKRATERQERENKKESKRRLQKYISKLKKDGLIEQTIENQILLTSLGLKKLKGLKSKPYNQEFKISKSSKVTIVSFDIPEEDRKSRNWLREVLKFLEFKLVHQSTWVGKTKIPEKLVERLEEKGILKYIKIFEVTKTGTLKELK